VRNLVILEVAAHLSEFKPLHVSDSLASSGDRVVHCIFDSVWRGADQLNLFVNVVTPPSKVRWIYHGSPITIFQKHYFVLLIKANEVFSEVFYL
jgi:hypothetical protein